MSDNMALPHDIEVIHERISDLKDVISELTIEVRTSNQMCNVCRPKVLGNGKDGYDTRIVRLEENQIENGEKRITNLESTREVSAWWITKVIAACSVVIGILSITVTIITHILSTGRP